MMFPMVTGNKFPNRKLPHVNVGNSSGVFPIDDQNEIRCTRFDEQSHRDEVNVCNAMLKSGCGKSRNRGNDGSDLIEDRSCAVTHPYGQTDQYIAHNSERDRRDEIQRRLGVSCGQCGQSDGAVPERILRRVEHQTRRQECTRKISGKRNCPIEQQVAACHLAVRPCHDDHVVAGKQFGPSNNHKDQSKGENQAGEQSNDAVRQCSRQ